jgi:hypothetical protein
MDKDNLEYLQKAVKYAGFADHFNTALEEQLKAQKEKFELVTTGEFGGSKVDYKLEFNQSQNNGKYYFNRLTAKLRDENPDKERTQMFFMNSAVPNKDDSEEVKQMKRKAHGVTAKEAFNLLQGRSVYKTLLNKEKEPYNAWIQLDFSKQDQYDNNEVRKFTDRYGFDLDKTLDKYPIKGLEDPEKRKQIIQSLEKGNRQQVTFDKEGKEEKMLIEAKPEFKNLEVFDMNFVRQGRNLNATRFTNENNTFSKTEANNRSAAEDISEGKTQGSEKKDKGQKETDEETGKKNSKRRGMKV